MRLHMPRSDDGAWHSAALDDVVEWDGRVCPFGEGPRWTGGLEKRDGRWATAQMHASLAVDKVREIVTKETPTSA